MSRPEDSFVDITDTFTQTDFDRYHANAIDFNADMSPIDITSESGRLLHTGRLILGATVEPPALYQDEYTFRTVRGRRMQSVARTIVSKEDDGAISVHQWETANLFQDGILAPQEVPEQTEPKVLTAQEEKKLTKDVYKAFDLALEKDMQIRMYRRK